VLNLANIHSTITYNANLSAAQAQIKALTAQIGTLTAAFNTLDKSALTAQRSLAATFAAGVGQTGGFTTSTVKATSAVETFGKQLAANRLTMREYFREAITGYTRQNSMMRRLAEQQVRYQQSIAVPLGGGQAMMMTPQSINAASNAAALASQRFAVFNQLMNGGATAMLNWGKNTQWAGRQLMVGFTVPLMLFTAVASKQFRELDKELTRFQKVYGSDLGNAISESTDRMREQVKQLAFDISSTYGIAAKETAALAADIAATGAEGEKLLSGVQQTTRLAVLGEVDRQEAMKATLSLQSAFKMNTNELAESINFLNAVENQTSATLQDLSTAIPKVGPVVRSLGGDVRDLATLLVAMREGGIPAAEAANALKSGLASLINPTKQASAVAKSFGVDLVGIVEANRGQLMPTIYAMQEALSGLDSFSRSRIIEQIFGKYQFARITALFDNIGRAGSQTQSVVELASKSSTELAAVANQELKVLTESTAVKFQRTLENLKNAIMPIGQTLTETLIPIFEFIGKGISTFSSFFQAIPGPIKNFAKYGVAIAALAGPIIMLVGLFGNLIANGIKFGLMLTRIGARIAGIKTEKFELLNQDVMAAKFGIDGLTKSFDTQENALRRLTGVLSSYEASLRRLTQSNPALFIPGAVPRGVGAPIRRQKGSTAAEKVPGGYGGGDRIPALLEPGEFVMTKEAVSKYAPVLTQMNRGTLPGFIEGLDERYYGTAGSTSAPTSLRQKIANMESVRLDVSSRMEILLDEMIKSGRIPPLTAKQRKDALGHSIAHVGSEYDERNRKVWRQDNLFFAPQAENNAFEHLFGKGRSAQRALMVSAIISKFGDSPEFRDMFGSPKKLPGDIKIDSKTTVPMYDIDANNVKAPSNPAQIRYISRLMSELFAPGALPLNLRPKSRDIWGPLLTGILNEKLAAIEGRMVGNRPPLFGVPQLLSQQRVPLPLGPPIQTRPGSVPPSMARPVGPGPRPVVMTPRGPMGVMPRELIVPPSRYADNGAIIDPDGSVKPLPANSSLLDRLAARAGRTPRPGPQYLGMPGMSITAGRQNFTGPVDGAIDSANQNRSMMRGQSMMNLAFGLSMAGSGIAMLGGQSSEAANKLMIFTTALSVGIMTLQAMQGFGVGGKLVGGVKAVGRGVQGVGGALGRVGGGAGIIGRFGGLLGAGGGALAGGGTAAALAVGGVAAAVTAVGVSLYLYKKSLNDVRDRAMAAFQDPVKTVEFFGKSVENVNETLKGFQVSQFSKDLDGVNDQLQEAVKQDYAGLISKIQTSAVSVGASNLAEAYNQMLISGLTAEEALESIKAIAVESGTAGGAAYAKAFGEGLLNSEDPEQAFNKLIDSIDPNSEFFQKRQASLQAEMDALRAQGNPVVPIGSTGYYRGGATAGYNSTTLDQMGSIQEEMGISGAAVFSAIKASMQMIDTNPELVAESAAKIRDAYLSLSTEGGGLFGIGESDQELAYDSFKNMMGELNDPQINKIMDSLQNATPEAQALAMELVSVGGSLIDAAGNSDVFNESLARAAVENVKRLRQLEEAIVDAKEELSAISEDPEMQRLIDLEEEALEKLIDQQERFGKKRERLREEQQDSFEESQDAIENEIELLTDQQDAIDKTTDTYINSLEKRSEAESFYSQQRKTALGALEKLASGDVFGFLQERESLSAAAQDFSIDQQIQDIEERRDLEIEALQDQVDKKEELMQLNQEAHEIAMENFDKETQKQADALQEQVDKQRTHVGDMNKFQDQIAQGQIVSYSRMREAFGDHLAEQYKMEFDQLMRSTAASLSAQVSLGRITAKEAENELLQLHRGFFPIISGTPGSVQGAPFSYSDLASIYTLPTVLGGRNPQSPGAGYYSPGNDTGSSAAGSTPAQPPAEYAGDYWPNEQNPTHQWNPNGGPNRKGGYELIATAYPPTERANGGPIKFGDGGGGKVSGPGGPKSDVIPAMLSNGEYVIQASSVGKYGKDMMDTINAGKFAYGGYISADRAETAASGNRYLGGVKPKQTYSGGTPTWSSGYNQANAQAISDIYGQKKFKNKGTPMRPVFGTPIPNAQDLSRISGYQENWFNTFLGSTWNSLLSGAGAAYSLTGLGGMRSLPTVRPNASNQLVMDEAAQYNLSARLAGMSPEEYAKIPGNIRAMEAALFTSSFTPGLGIAAGSIIRGGIRGAKGLLSPRTGFSRTPIAGPAAYGRGWGETYLESKYRDAIIAHLTKLSDNPNASMPEGLSLEISNSTSPKNIAMLEAFISKYPYSPYAQQYLRSISGVKGSVRPVRIMERETLEKLTPLALKLLEDMKNSSRIPGVIESNQVRFNKVAISDPDFIKLSESERKELLDLVSFHGYYPENVSHSSRTVGQDNWNWEKGQININDGNLFALLSTIAHESGHTTDFLFGASRIASFNSGDRAVKGGIFGDIIRAARFGKTEGYAEVNRMRSIHELLSNIGADPQDIKMFTSEGMGVYPYQPGGAVANSYANSPVFKAMFAKTLSKVMKGKDPYFELPPGFTTKNSGISTDVIESFFPWMKHVFSNPNNPAIAKIPPMMQVPTKDEIVRLSGRHSKIDESILDNVFGTTAGAAAGGHTPINPGGWVVGADGVRRYVKSSVYGGPSVVYTEAMLAKMYRALGLEVPDVDLLTIGGKTRSYAPNRSFQPGSLVLSSREIENVKTLSQVAKIDSPLHKEMLGTLNQEEGIGYAVDQLFGIKDLATNLGNYGIKYDPNNPSTLLNPVRIDLGSNVFQDAGGNLIPFDPNYPLGKPKGLASHQKPPLHVGISPLAKRNQVARLQDVITSRGGIRGLLDQAMYELSQTSPTYTLGNPDFVEFVLQRRLQGLLDGEYLYANGGLVQKFAEGGPVEMKKALDKWAGPKLKYHGGWSSAGSWGKPYPGGIMMHHTSAPATDAQVGAFRDGYDGYDGPIVQSVISRDGTGHIIGYGNRNIGAGPGTTQYMGGNATRQGPQKDLDIMKGIIDAAGSANAALFQMEVISEGKVQDFTAEQFDTIAKISSGLREWMGWPTFQGRIINHKDWAGYRTDGKAKADTLYPRSVFENNANKIWENNGGKTSSGNSGGKGGKGSGGRNSSNVEETLAKPLMGLYGPLALLSDGITKGKEGKSKTKPAPDGTYETPQGNNPDGVLAVEFAKKQLGEPYAINGDGPDKWDCSGLTAAAYNVGVPDGYKKYSLVSYSTDQANRIRIVSRRKSGTPGDGSAPEIEDNFNIGDILYFTNTPYPQSYKHVSMYAGNGQIIEAGDPVQINPLNNDFNKKYFTFGGPPIPKYAAGGFISGPGGPKSDMIPAMLSNGEYVVKASSVAKYGKGFMDQINSGSLNPSQGSSMQPARFANGGMVGSAPMPAFSMPEMADTSVGVNNTTYGGNSSSSSNKTNVKVVINGAGGKGANAIANKVVSMINSANNRRNHSRSI